MADLLLFVVDLLLDLLDPRPRLVPPRHGLPPVLSLFPLELLRGEDSLSPFFEEPPLLLIPHLLEPILSLLVVLPDLTTGSH